MIRPTIDALSASRIREVPMRALPSDILNSGSVKAIRSRPPFRDAAKARSMPANVLTITWV